MECAELYYKKIKELIEDDDKIVTIPYLAMSLRTSIDTSQKLLEQYVAKKNKCHEMTVTYVLRGFLKNCKRKGLFITEHSNLQAKRHLFEKVDDELIFSIQKSKNIDFSIISLVDKIDSTERNGPLQGLIVGNQCLKRKELEKLPMAPALKPSLKPSFFVPKSDEKNMEICSKSVSNSGIVDLSLKTVVPPIQQDSQTNKSAAEKNKSKRGKSGISGFFKTVSSKNVIDSKISDQKVEGTSKIENSPEGVESAVGEGKEDSTSFTEVPEETEENETIQRIFTAKSKLMDKKNNKRRREESTVTNIKRRRRIVERDDSESDDMFEKTADEDIIDKCDDEPESVSMPDVKKLPETKNRIRKTIDKTYQDSEGFIVTKTEYIYETASEEDYNINIENNGVKPEIKSVENKEILSTENNISPQKSTKKKQEKKKNKQNQPTLMNFFKKK